MLTHKQLRAKALAITEVKTEFENARAEYAVLDEFLKIRAAKGFTQNQIAEKIKNKEVAKNVTGLAIVGSFKGFDVITDV